MLKINSVQGNIGSQRVSGSSSSKSLSHPNVFQLPTAFQQTGKVTRLWSLTNKSVSMLADGKASLDERCEFIVREHRPWGYYLSLPLPRA